MSLNYQGIVSIYVRHDLFLVEEFNAPDTYVQTVKLVIESHVLDCTPWSQRLSADLGKVKWTSVSWKIVLIPPLVVMLRRLVGASSATWAYQQRLGILVVATEVDGFP